MDYTNVFIIYKTQNKLNYGVLFKIQNVALTLS